MQRKYVKGVSKLLACAMGFSLLCGNGMSVYAEGGGFTTENAGAGVAITGIGTAVIKNGDMVEIPDTLQGKNVTRLGGQKETYTFLGRYPIKKLIIGKNISGITSYAFFGAKNLEEIDTASNSRFTVADNAFFSPRGGLLIKYLSTAARTDYTVPDSINTIFNMDHANFGSLDLNQAAKMYQLSLAGSEIDSLTIRSEMTVDGGHDILYGASVGQFNTDPDSGYETDGTALWYGDRLIKLSSDASVSDFTDGYFNRFTSISPYAFNSISQYKRMEELIPEELTKNIVFSFFNQDEGVFVINGEISFCYNYNLKVPTQVGDVTDYSAAIDADKYNQIRALMYVGVPFDGTGLFKETFGISYAEANMDPEVAMHGNAALNAVSAMVYKIVDNTMPAEIRGIGYGPFTEKNVEKYLEKLQNAVENFSDYNFTPGFESTVKSLSFKRQGNSYVSDPITIQTKNGSGEIDNSYVYTINITTPGITVSNTGETSFQTGEPVVFKSLAKPEEITFSYNEPSLKYYKRTSSNVQNVLVSSTREEKLDIHVTVGINSFPISKVDATNGKPVIGAHMKLLLNGEPFDDWITEKEDHIITNPPDGIYTLIEEIAPNSYELAENIEFEVINGEVVGGPIVMEDAPKATPSTPSEPDEPATPSEPDEPEKPATPSEPDKPATPSNPDRPNHGGSSGGGSGSHSGGGSYTPTPTKPYPQLVSVKPEIAPVLTLPKTSGIPASYFFAVVSLLMLLYLALRRKTLK